MQKTILNPAATRALVPRLASARNRNVWVYRYVHPNGWRLSIATHAEPGSDKLSLGGLRIALEERTSVPGFDSDVEAIELAIVMEDKVHWSRTIGVAGPLARRDMRRIAGAKCVLHPSPDARIGQPRDRDLLDFAVACLADCDRSAGIRITTGPDLGHGLMSDGQTQSLQYLHNGFRGSVMADTSKPTGEGNYHVLLGMLRAFGFSPDEATVGLIGAGNIGMHIIDRLQEHGTRMTVVERRPEVSEQLRQRGISTRWPEEKMSFLAQPMDALVLNASAGSLGLESIRACVANRRLKVVCGSENLAVPNPPDAHLFRDAEKVFCPTEIGGMMGYLTAVEAYLAQLEGVPFELKTMLVAASELARPAYDATKYILDSDFGVDFEQAIEAMTSQRRTH